jgi:hypothetical protein
VFHANVATLPSDDTPSESSAPPTRRLRSAQAPYVMRSSPPAVAVETVLFGYRRSTRLKIVVSVSG